MLKAQSLQTHPGVNDGKVEKRNYVLRFDDLLAKIAPRWTKIEKNDQQSQRKSLPMVKVVNKSVSQSCCQTLLMQKCIQKKLPLNMMVTLLKTSYLFMKLPIRTAEKKNPNQMLAHGKEH